MHLADSGPWYTSSTFYSVAGLIAVIVIGFVTIFVMVITTSTKRQITYHLAEDTPLLVDSDALPQTGIKVVRDDGRPLANPRVVAVRMESRGVKDIAASEFDGNSPLVIDLGIEIVELLAVHADPEIDQKDIAIAKTRLLIGPCTIRKRQDMTFGFLADGGKPTLSHKDAPLDVVLRHGADGRQPLQGFWTRRALAGVGVGAVLGGAAALGGAAVLGVTGVADVGVASGAIGTDAGLTQLAIAAAVTTIAAITTSLKRRRSRQQHS
jgi:hypothetical protein